MKNLVIAFICLSYAGAMAQSITPVATGLNSPRGIAVGPGGSMYVVEAGLGSGDSTGIGLTGSVTEINGPGNSHSSQRRIITGLASTENEGSIVGADGISVHGNGDIYIAVALSSQQLAGEPGATAAALAQFGHLLKASQGGQWKSAADVGGFDYEWTLTNKNAPFAPAGQFPDANPYAVLALGGHQYVVDAAANTINEVQANGSIRIVAYVPNPQLPAVLGGPPVITISDAVPTCVAQGSDGYLYVGTLAFGANFARFAGLPFWPTLPPQSKVYRFLPDASSSIQFLTEANVWASGFNPITGCGFGRGAFYVTEFITQDSGYSTGAVVKTAINPDGSAGARTAMGVGLLHQANGFAAGADGSVYVSNYSTSAGIGQVVRVDN
jgi:hypothetical protein